MEVCKPIADRYRWALSQSRSFLFSGSTEYQILQRIEQLSSCRIAWANIHSGPNIRLESVFIIFCPIQYLCYIVWSIYDRTKWLFNDANTIEHIRVLRIRLPGGSWFFSWTTRTHVSLHNPQQGFLVVIRGRKYVLSRMYHSECCYFYMKKKAENYQRRVTNLHKSAGESIIWSFWHLPLWCFNALNRQCCHHLQVSVMEHKLRENAWTGSLLGIANFPGTEDPSNVTKGAFWISKSLKEDYRRHFMVVEWPSFHYLIGSTPRAGSLIEKWSD